MRSSGLSIKTVVAIGIGAAVFVILGRFASIPTWMPSVSIETTYAFLALMSVVFGPIAGCLIGLIGHALKDLIFYGNIWWSWVIGSAFVGLFIGFGAKWLKIRASEGVFQAKQILTFNIVQIIVQAIGWFLLAPTLDILIYAEPSNKVYTQGTVAGISNIIAVAVLGTILIATYAKTRSQTGSLSRES